MYKHVSIDFKSINSQSTYKSIIQDLLPQESFGSFVITIIKLEPFVLRIGISQYVKNEAMLINCDRYFFHLTGMLGNVDVYLHSYCSVSKQFNDATLYILGDMAFDEIASNLYAVISTMFLHDQALLLKGSIEKIGQHEILVIGNSDKDSLFYFDVRSEDIPYILLIMQENPLFKTESLQYINDINGLVKKLIPEMALLENYYISQINPDTSINEFGHLLKGICKQVLTLKVKTSGNLESVFKKYF